MTEETYFEAETYDPIQSEPGKLTLTGLSVISGTFSGSLEGELPWPQTPTTIYFYGPDPDLPWWRHWFYRAREIIRGTPYPTVCLASGPVEMRLEGEDTDVVDGRVTMSATFTSRGDWTFHDKEVNP
jgi:hypothetical protein